MYILDTNAAYYLIDTDRISAAQLQILQEKCEHGLEFGLSPITVLELASRVVEEPAWFGRVKNVAQILVTLKPTALADPEQRMREIVAGITLARQSYDIWPLILDALARAPDADSLQRGFDEYASMTRRSLDLQRLSNYREDYERAYVREMLNVVRQLNPKYDSQAMNGDMTKLPRLEQKALQAFFSTGEWAAAFVAMLAFRGSSPIVTMDDGKLALLLKKARYFKEAYEALGLSIFCNGKRPTLKTKNDYNDIHQLLYVDDFTTNVLVSDDGGLFAKVRTATGKVITFAELLAREAAG